MNISKPVSSSISAVEFGFLTEDEIKSLSVKRIVNPTTFDLLDNVIPGGLYDFALGAYGDNPCTTCNLNRMFCPGHCGHIELPVPVYHPSYFEQTVRLIRAQCPFCYKLRISRDDVNRFCCKLRLVRYGLIDEANQIDVLHLRGDFARYAAPGARGIGRREDAAVSDSESDEDKIQNRESFVKESLRQAGRDGRRSDWTQEKQEVVSQARRTVVREFFALASDPRACKNCLAKCPKYKRDRFVKIFRVPRNEKDAGENALAGRSIKAARAVLLARERAAMQTKKHKEKSLAHGPIDEGVADLSSPASEEEGDDVNSSESEEEPDGGEGSAAGVVAADEGADDSDSDSRKSAGKKPKYIDSMEVHALLTLLFEKESQVLDLIYGPRATQRKHGSKADMFFVRSLLVPPNKFRPEAKTGNRIAEAASNKPYQAVLQACQLMSQIQRETNDYDAIQQPWITLQNQVNGLIDREKNPGARKSAEDGVKQKLEKKEGLFRHNMMGKRVNFAARTVISPDPNIETNEIGVPPVFARKLTYPEPVMSENYYELKQAVLNGPETWPGATAIENEHGQVINLRSKTYDERMALANQLMAPSNTQSNGARGKKVHRHLNNGDIVIMNRQPTLHKPSMMCHRAKVLPSERTLRMHYANCNTYNADFDGDEMNMHFPQNEVSRAEALTIADTDHQYLSATAGKPLRGLIQDHISICVQLTKRDTFFSREEYHQLLYASLRPENSHTATSRLVTIPPAIRKPRALWTGKQVISTVLENLVPKERAGGLTILSDAQTDKRLWGDSSEEQQVIFDSGYFAQGVLDKKQIGPSKGGFVHSVYEAYGQVIAGRLLSVLGRLLTKMLHTHAFSCGVEDLVLTPKADLDRADRLKDVAKVGLDVATKYVSLDDVVPKPASNDPELLRRLEYVLRDDSKQAVLDDLMKSEASKVSEAVEKACNPIGLVKPFPKNQMQTMTNSGAKGSKVNANLISCNLGSQVLEARRVPTMVSGRTLPSFKPFETSLRAGGYITQRFLTGVRPQEYFFHAMAGREGLIDTAVKTSRSGYLQRCVVKGMEGLRVEYDTSVRDVDGTMVQFLYGEDGLDVAKATYLDNFSFAAKNFWSLYEALSIRDEYNKLLDQNGELDEYIKDTQKAVKKAKKTGDDDDVPDPAINLWQPGRWIGAISEKMQDGLREYTQENPDKLINDRKKKITGKLGKGNFEGLIRMKYLKSVVDPGEAVGVVAGQSIGEPSTQMTLNTFHLAGHSAKNVTQGIPRLREIVMTASPNISTPSMTLRVIDEIAKTDAAKFAKGISRITLADVIDTVEVQERVCKGIGYPEARMYKIKLQLFPQEEYDKEYAINSRDVLEAIECKFIPRLVEVIKKEHKRRGEEKLAKNKPKSDALPEVGKTSGREARERDPELDEDGNAVARAVASDDEDDEDDATNAKEKQRKKEEASYSARDKEENEALEEAGIREGTPENEENEGRTSRANSIAPSQQDADEEMSDDAKEKRKRARVIERAAAVEERIKNKHSEVVGFDFDYVSGNQCKISLEYDAATSKLLVLNIVENCCHKTVVQNVDGLKWCVASSDKIPDPAHPKERKEVTVIYTEGVNIPAMWQFQHVLDPYYIYTNSIHDMLKYYGVEAARATIVSEMSAVFESHTISVDNRHLNLIADVMTRSGRFVGFNRLGMASSTSPFMKMSFETTVGFLKDAVLAGESDELKGPSARIVVGKLGTMGTGMVDILMPVKKAIETDDDEDSDDEGGQAEGGAEADRMSL